MLETPFQLGTLTLANRGILAPLAGVSDVPFRRICQELGAGLTYVEMLSAVALLIRNRRTVEMLARHESESVLGVQVTGPDPERVHAAVTVLDRAGFDAIDLNMGCPVRKVVGSGLGSALLKDTGRLEQIVAAARAATKRPLSVKIRLGFTPDTINVEANAAAIARAGADMITIHGRTREDTYAVRVSMPGIAAGIAAARAVNPRIVTVGNGDLMAVADAVRMREATGCDAVMVSRGALGNPWIFRALAGKGDEDPTVEEWAAVVDRHLDYHAAHYGESQLSARLTRKHLLWYASGFPHVNRLRLACNSVDSIDDARRVISDFAKQLPPDLRRGEDRPRDAGAAADPKFQMDRELDRGVGCEELSNEPTRAT
ncbi:MAG TPA: tRNA-dihydrouridine synthase [Kiritimatiellia bacterium]|nr:tRNA-dihydrouridine synthase [Kiritimatiellia bacterium]